MSAEYAAGPQTIPAGGSVVFNFAPVPCNQGLIYHREGSGLFRLASPEAMGSRCRRQCCCGGFLNANYVVDFHGNIGLAEGGAAGPLSLAIYVDGEEDLSSEMIVQAAEAGDYYNVGASVIVQVPCICRCSTLSVRNTSDQEISLNNANLVFGGVKVRF